MTLLRKSLLAAMMTTVVATPAPSVAPTPVVDAPAPFSAPPAVAPAYGSARGAALSDAAIAGAAV